MKLIQIATAILLSCCVLPVAWSCKLSPSAYDLKPFWEKDNPRKVVFLGEVASVKEVPSNEVLHDQRIQFVVHRQWAGKPQPVVNARGIVAKPNGSDCDSVWDFAVSTGQEWLIVGYEETEDGATIVRPSALLSRQLNGGRLPKDVASVLNTPVFTGMKISAARKIIMKSGWKPQRTKSSASAETEAFLKAGYREVEICAGTGLNPCVFNYKKNKTCLRIDTVGASPDNAIVVNASPECHQTLP